MSLSYSFEVSGVEEFTLAMDVFSEEIRSQVREVFHELGANMKEFARAIVPVRTGYLQSTIYYRTVEWEITVGARALYAGYVEYGTRYMASQAYLGPAFDFYEPQVVALMVYAIEEAKLAAGL